ncbi:hypothetical protein M4951_11525 [Blastopirellula sp. J2-11]|uniref:hypothetical protein n=1 Tax=Blastopirellula sp. J2-11 TaxID=2943192 RepID=UPI0021C6EA65|nr:hypothetical protein [Blastopirellula sp. J2-11]UUO08921.1 hypothetical protein M4951_11525 [Blastopirellula sp. J2-11]
MNRIFLGLAFAALGLTLGCQGKNAQLNPFSAYGPQRVPPPATGSYAQPGTTAPYYQPTGQPSATLGAPAAGTYAPPGGTLAPPPGASPYGAPPAQYPGTNAPPATWTPPAASNMPSSGINEAGSSQIQLTSANEPLPVPSVTTAVPATGSSSLQTQGMAPNEPAGGLNWNAVSQ